MSFRKGLAVALVLTSLSSADAGIVYSSDKKDKTEVRQNVDTSEIYGQISKKYSGKGIQYFSRGFLQTRDLDFIKDDKIDGLVQKLGSGVDGVNFKDNYCVMIDADAHHIGDSTKSWFPIQESEGKVYEKKFTLFGVDGMVDPRLAMETFTCDSENKVYINGKEVGIVPAMSKSKWGKLLKKYKEETPFLYGEIPVAGYLREGENTVRIESKVSGFIFKNYDDFMMRRLQIIHGDRKE